MLKFLEKTFLGDSYHTRITVKFINHLTDYVIHEEEIEQVDLPEDFAIIATVTLHEKIWMLVNATPVHANQYSLTKKLELRLNPPDLKFEKKQEDPAAGVISFGSNKPA